MSENDEMQDLAQRNPGRLIHDVHYLHHHAPAETVREIVNGYMEAIYERMKVDKTCSLDFRICISGAGMEVTLVNSKGEIVCDSDSGKSFTYQVNDIVNHRLFPFFNDADEDD